MTGVVVDVVVVTFVVLAVWSGLRAGLVRGAAAWLGLLSGGVLGIAAAALLAPRVDGEVLRTATVVLLVVTGAVVGRHVGAGVGDRLDQGAWRRRTWLRRLDAMSGGVLAGAVALIAAWLVLGVAIAPAVPAVASAVGASRVLGQVAETFPDTWDDTARHWGDQLVTEALPRVLGDPVPPPMPVVPDEPSPAATTAPTPAAADSTDALGDMVRAAQPSIVKITGTAAECGLTVSGTGIVYAEHRVLTAAHVVAGVSDPVVHSGGRRLPATVVYHDGVRDVAVLAVPTLRAAALAFDDTPAGGGDTAVVAGYPKGGDFATLVGRVVRMQELISDGGDGAGEVSRDVYQVQAAIVSGYSGGPLLSPEGKVYGMVFASARLKVGTGYAMTASFLADAVSAGVRADAEVRTGRCQAS